MNFEDLRRFGRFSFKGFNKEVEEMAKAEERGEGSGEEEEEEEGVSVSAKEMAERYDVCIIWLYFHQILYRYPGTQR